MSKLTSENISHLSRLARLDLHKEEVERYSQQLSSVIGYVEKLAQAQVQEDGPLTGVTGLSNVLSADRERAENDLSAADKDDILNGAPSAQDGYFVVRAVMSEEAGSSA